MTHEELLHTLEQRFLANPRRHPNISWDNVAAALAANPEKCEVLLRMEETAGEPDVIEHSAEGFLFIDCYIKNLEPRKNVCYDKASRVGRKKFPPKSSALEEVEKIGSRLLTEELYTLMQSLDEFDLTISTWLETEPGVRERGGAIFGDRRFNRVFFYHNGADSYYGVRGFRTYLYV